MKTEYLRETHHEFLQASQEALADTRLQQILGQLNVEVLDSLWYTRYVTVVQSR